VTLVKQGRISKPPGSLHGRLAAPTRDRAVKPAFQARGPVASAGRKPRSSCTWCGDVRRSLQL